MLSYFKSILKSSEIERKSDVAENNLKIATAYAENVPTLIRNSFEKQLRSVSDNSLDFKNDFKIYIEVVENNLDENVYINYLSKYLSQQDFDIYISISGQLDLAFIYSRDNTIRKVSIFDLDSGIQNIIKLAVENIEKLRSSNNGVMSFRNKTTVLNEYYKKFFNYDVTYAKMVANLNSSLHLINTADSNDGTYIAARLLKHSSSRNRPTIVYFPGTAYSRLLYATIEKEAYRLASSTACNVFVVLYRLTPENIFPIPLLDAYSAYQYLLSMSGKLELATNQYMFMGYSSGASIALQFYNALLAFDKLTMPTELVLISPTLDFSYLRNNNDDSVKDTDRFLTIKFIQSLQIPYFLQVKTLNDARVSPFYSNDTVLKSMPKIFMFIAENDIFTPQYERFLTRLTVLNLKISFVRIPLLDHCSWWDNLLQTELVSNWILKQYSLENNIYSKVMVERYNEFFTLTLNHFKATANLPFSSTDDIEKHLIDEAYNNLMYERYELKTFIETADKYPDNIALQIYAIFAMILSENISIVESKRLLDRLNLLCDKSCFREMLLIAALSFSLKGQLQNGIDQFYNILRQWPEDLLSGMMADFHSRKLKKFENQLVRWDNIKPHYIKEDHRITDSPQAGMYLAIYSYALALNGQAHKALFCAGQSMALNPFNPFAQFSFSYACQIINEPEKANVILDKYKYLPNQRPRLFYKRNDSNITTDVESKTTLRKNSFP